MTDDRLLELAREMIARHKILVRDKEAAGVPDDWPTPGAVLLARAVEAFYKLEAYPDHIAEAMTRAAFPGEEHD